ncbi:LOW QUALITY PROTEIN: hypothetical protein TorRG33x02_215110 [Trema orientale]|uniref:Uncharacterized protein n=1 Tax=Trema orientale TaxID=63057 RepID=A0A2P5EAY8_TREOI|nr:LOW QUALITY PROTEIN: hypothetical protein TorRG33x02_215110 [Trema orientale]
MAAAAAALSSLHLRVNLLIIIFILHKVKMVFHNY